MSKAKKEKKEKKVEKKVMSIEEGVVADKSESPKIPRVEPTGVKKLGSVQDLAVFGFGSVHAYAQELGAHVVKSDYKSDVTPKHE